MLNPSKAIELLLELLKEQPQLEAARFNLCNLVSTYGLEGMIPMASKYLGYPLIAKHDLVGDKVDSWLDTYYITQGAYQGYRLSIRQLQPERILYLLMPDITALPKSGSGANHCEDMRYKWFLMARMYMQVNRMRGGTYAEFGCHSAQSFRYALNTIGLPEYTCFTPSFYAFDSFEGMPEPTGIDCQETWRKGMNFSSVEQFIGTKKKMSIVRQS